MKRCFREEGVGHWGSTRNRSAALAVRSTCRYTPLGWLQQHWTLMRTERLSLNSGLPTLGTMSPPTPWYIPPLLVKAWKGSCCCNQFSGFLKEQNTHLPHSRPPTQPASHTVDLHPHSRNFLWRSETYVFTINPCRHVPDAHRGIWQTNFSDGWGKHHQGTAAGWLSREFCWVEKPMGKMAHWVTLSAGFLEWQIFTGRRTAWWRQRWVKSGVPERLWAVTWCGYVNILICIFPYTFTRHWLRRHKASLSCTTTSK